MNTLNTLDPQDWNTVAPYFSALADEYLKADDVSGWLLRGSELEKTLGEAGSWANRAKSEDTTNSEAEKAYLNFVQQIVPAWSVAAQGLKTKLLGVPGYEPDAGHMQFLRRLRNDADLFRAENVPIQAQLQTLANEYDKRTGPMGVTVNGQRMTVPEAEALWQSPDRHVREEAWRAVMDCWSEARAELDALFLKQLPLRRKLAENAGLPDYRAYMWRAMRRFDYTPAETKLSTKRLKAKLCPLRSG